MLSDQMLSHDFTHTHSHNQLSELSCHHFFYCWCPLVVSRKLNSNQHYMVGSQLIPSPSTSGKTIFNYHLHKKKRTKQTKNRILHTQCGSISNQIGISFHMIMENHQNTNNHFKRRKETQGERRKQKYSFYLGKRTKTIKLIWYSGKRVPSNFRYDSTEKISPCLIAILK
jgi:hypothetical protein